jgi:hypothetical protein
LQKEGYPRPVLGIVLTSIEGLEFHITIIVNYKNTPVENNG